MLANNSNNIVIKKIMEFLLDPMLRFFCNSIFKLQNDKEILN